MKNKIYNLLIILLFACSLNMQAATVPNASWSDVARGRCSDQTTAWWSSAEALRIADNVLLYQKNCGGWPKNINMHMVLTDTQKSDLIAAKPGNKDCTIDNGAVYYELSYLSKVYQTSGDETFKTNIKTAFIKGIQYLLNMQYTNGGWPQFYPLKGGYSNHITYNDDAMIRVMGILRHVYQKDSEYSIKADSAMVDVAKIAFDKGLQCVLKTQFIQKGKLTVWCAQHHYSTLIPVLARSYELPSLSGAESAGIITLLMSINNPSKEIKRAVYSAVKWYESVKITGQRLESFTNTDGLSDKRVVLDPSASPMWGRFYTLDYNQPFFCDRDGIMKFSLAEIGYERRNGYSWYNTSGNNVATANASWLPKWGTTIIAAPLPGHIMYSADTVKIMAFANKYKGSNLKNFELIVDNTQSFGYNSAYMDTVLSGLPAGMHTLIVKSVYENGSAESDTVNLKVEASTSLNKINENKNHSTFCFPNPASDSFTIKSETSGVAEIYDTTGKIIYQEPVKSGFHYINTLNFLPGLYYVKLIDQINNSKIQKLVIKK